MFYIAYADLHNAKGNVYITVNTENEIKPMMEVLSEENDTPMTRFDVYDGSLALTDDTDMDDIWMACMFWGTPEDGSWYQVEGVDEYEEMMEHIKELGYDTDSIVCFDTCEAHVRSAS